MLIIIDGPINSGKTTVSRCLADLLGQCIVIECDHLRHFADCLPLDQSIPFTLQDAADLAVKWIDRSFSVIINYPIASCELYHVLDRLSPDVDTHIFTLQPPLETCIRQRGARVLSQREIARIHEMSESRAESGVIGDVIDNSNMTPHECAATIKERIANQKLKRTR